MKKTLITTGAIVLVVGTAGAAMAATSTSADVTSLAGAESNVVTLLHHYQDTPAWKAKFKTATAVQQAALAKLNVELRATGPTSPPTTAKPGTASGGLTSFGDGTRLIGSASTDIAPGTYRTADPSGCYWARLSGLGGTLSDIISNSDAVGPAIVTISPTDKAFDSEGCGTWGPLPASGRQATSFGSGTWAVGTEIASGTYSAPGGSGCYWARLSAFSGGIAGIIANDDATGPVVVSVLPTDKGFQANGCGTFTKAS